MFFHPSPIDPSHRPFTLSVAPMLDWTDRHCRYFHRLLSGQAVLYTEMVHANALIHGSQKDWQDVTPAEGSVVLQLGGSEPNTLAQAARLGAQWGYSAINLNCGCPSPRVQKGAFGACLMQTPELVAQAVDAMQTAVTHTRLVGKHRPEITVKHRIGLGREEDETLVRQFVEIVSQAGCKTFIVHARNAWLEGLSPKENRHVPPLRYEVVYRLQQDFPHLTFVLNGGVRTLPQIAQITADQPRLTGLMMGRWAYEDPWSLTQWDAVLSPSAVEIKPEMTRETIEQAMVTYMSHQAEQHGIPWRTIARHMLGLYKGQPGARAWRRVWSDPQLKNQSPQLVSALAQQALKKEARFQ
jgi:tRNA-dihydrouridine synthase A